MNSNPQLAVERLIGTYEAKNTPEYQQMFTGDFSYEFSTATDPTLATQYATGWFKNDEKESANHLFNGYTPPGQSIKPAATTINISLATDVPSDDNTSGLNPKTHKVLATRVDGAVTIPASTEPLTIIMTNNYNVLYLVRGDAAVGLDSTQVADSTRWYVYRWVDLTGATASGSPARGPTPTKPATWGSLKASYR